MRERGERVGIKIKQEDDGIVSKKQWNEDGKVIEVVVVVKYVWRKGGELIGIEVHE